MLAIKEVSAGYGKVSVLHSVDGTFPVGKITAVLGANGAGKTTLLAVMAGLIRFQRGSLEIDGRQLTRFGAGDAVDQGVTLVPEGRHIFGNLSVRDNLILGAYKHRRSSAKVSEALDSALELFPALVTRLPDPAGLLSGGQQQMLAIARGLMSGPRLLLLDEPSLGLAPVIVGEIFQAIGRLRDMGVGVVLSEQNGKAALGMAEHAYVLERGRVTVEGGGTELLARNDIQDRFLGVSHETGTSTGNDLLERSLLKALSG